MYLLVESNHLSTTHLLENLQTHRHRQVVFKEIRELVFCVQKLHIGRQGSWVRFVSELVLWEESCYDDDMSSFLQILF
jgi:hypothetical protein